jgi:hypothetical protein
MKHHAPILIFIFFFLLGFFFAASANPGKERWSQKCLLDGFVPQNISVTTVGWIKSQKFPVRWTTTLPRQAIEKNFLMISGKIVEAGREQDSDIHLVIDDGTGKIVCEIPKPEYAEPKYVSTFQAEREWVEKTLGPLGAIKPVKKDVRVVASGVLFRDRPHGFNKETGGWELHPLMAIRP